MKTTLLLLCSCLLYWVSYGQVCPLAADSGIPAPIMQMITDAEAQGTTGPIREIVLYFSAYKAPGRDYYIDGIHNTASSSVVNLSETSVTNPLSIGAGYRYDGSYTTSGYPFYKDNHFIALLQLYISFQDDPIQYGLYGTGSNGWCPQCELTRDLFFWYANNWSLTGYRISFRSGDNVLPPPLWAPECLPEEPGPCATAPTITIQQPPTPE